jgi:hypothetical protein
MEAWKWRKEVESQSLSDDDFGRKTLEVGGG